MAGLALKITRLAVVCPKDQDKHRGLFTIHWAVNCNDPTAKSWTWKIKDRDSDVRGLSVNQVTYQVRTVPYILGGRKVEVLQLDELDRRFHPAFFSGAPGCMLKQILGQRCFEPLLDAANLMPDKWASITPQTVGLDWIEDTHEEGHWELSDPEEEINDLLLKVHSRALTS